MNSIRCPDCGHIFSESEKLLCQIPDGHYCPKCWTRTPEARDRVSQKVESDMSGSANQDGALAPSGSGIGTHPESASNPFHGPGVTIESELCKGCDFCVDVCPEDCLYMAEMINSRGYRYARYEGDRCTGCGICYYNCPEPGSIVVYKNDGKKKESING